jgi:GAF domain-containing protein
VAVGLEAPLAAARETPLSHSFCRQTLQTREPVIVADARIDPTFRENPAVAEHGVVAYAGIPLITSEGHAMGAFCVVEHAPRAMERRGSGVLRALASAAVSEIELRRPWRMPWKRWWSRGPPSYAPRKRDSASCSR